MPPPIRSDASCTTTSMPARASVIAAARPFGPEPMTTALRAKDFAHACDAEPVRELFGRLAVVRRVRRHDQVRRDRYRRRRLLRQDVERCTAETSVTQRLQNGPDIDDAAARRVDEQGARPHRRDLIAFK